MPRKKVVMGAPLAISDQISTIIAESSNPLGPSSPPVALSPPLPDHSTESTVYPDPTTLDATPTVDTEFPTVEQLVAEDRRVNWSIEMIVALVECIYQAFKKGKLSGGGLKKELWNEVAIAVRLKSDGQFVSAEKYKNKWGADIKEKWKHWKILGNLSGMGWNENSELYEANDYV